MAIVTKVSNIISHLNKFANPGLAYSWDNVGFQLGDANCEVHKILLSLDVTENAIDKAIAEKCDMIISHHPFIFKPIKKITNPIYLKLIKNDISVYCAHTNLDVVKGGVNSILADRLGLKVEEFISLESGSKMLQIAVQIPNGYVDEVTEAVLKVGAGRIGNYSECCSKTKVLSQFKPETGSEPAIGKIDELESVSGIKLEFFVESIDLSKVLRALEKAHPYEVPAYSIFPQENGISYGLGVIGKLEKPLTMKSFAEDVKSRLGAPKISLWPANKDENSLVEKVAVCGGSGSSLLSKLYGRADIFVSADFTYHTVLDSKIPLIDAGHFYTENPVLDVLENLLKFFDCEIIRLSMDEHEISKLIHI